MASHNFQPGDVVQLTSGVGPLMSIVRIENDGLVVVWFKDDEIKSHKIASAAVKKVES